MAIRLSILLINILFLINILLIIKIYFMRKSIREIEISLDNILNENTNNLITISSSDKKMKKLASLLNVELKKLRKERLQYENGNQGLKNMVTNISHDMRTPLTVISGYVELINENKEYNEKYIDIIERKTKELTALTEELFDYSKTMDMGIKIAKENCCVNEILENTLISYYSIFKSKNLRPQIKISENKIYKNVNRGAVVRVFENIISNVIKYGEGDFEVVLDDSGKVVFSNETSKLDTTTVEKIFDRYYTVENARSSTGIGLSIAKQLIELNGGEISAKYLDNHFMIEIEFNVYG